MCHVCLDEVSSCQGAAKAEFASQDTCSHDTSETTSIVTRIGGMGAFDSEQVKHGALRFEDGTAADCANFDGRHRNTNLKISIVTIIR